MTSSTQMRPGMGTLLEILSGSEMNFDPEVNWNEVLDLAEEQHVLPTTAAYLRNADQPLPANIEERVTKIERECAGAAFWWTSELKGVLAHFSAEGIDTILLKGPFFAERIYGNARLRISSDIDVLVRGTQLLQARELLAKLGFEVSQQDNGHHESWSRGTTALELHYDVAPRALFDFHIETAWSVALPSVFAGQPTLCLQPLDELLFLCLHGTRHCFDCLGHVLDVALFLDHLAEKNPNRLLRVQGRADTQPLAGVLVFGVELARQLRPGNAWPLEMPFAPREQIRLEGRAHEHWRRLLTQPAPARNWASIRRFYRNTEGSRRSYARRALRDARDGAALLIEADYTFAQRLGIARERRWMVRIARYLRLAAKYAEFSHKL
jgi:hypothetical protein